MTNPIAKALTVTVSPMFTAILDYALDNQHSRTSPRIRALAITRDGFLVGWNDDNPLVQGVLGAVCTAPHFPGPPGGVIHGTEMRRT